MSTCGPHCNGCPSCPLPDGGYSSSSNRSSENGITRNEHLESLIGMGTLGSPHPISSHELVRAAAENARKLSEIESERQEALKKSHHADAIVTVGNIGVVAAITAVLCPPALLITVPAMAAFDAKFIADQDRMINAKYDEKAKKYK